MNPEIICRDTSDYFRLVRDGTFPVVISTNADMDDWQEQIPVARLDQTWPACIPDDGVEQMKFPIETGIQMPPKYQTDGLVKDITDTMADLKIGESFFVPYGTTKPERVRHAITSARYKLGKKLFCSRKSMVAPLGIRIWRIE